MGSAAKRPARRRLANNGWTTQCSNGECMCLPTQSFLSSRLIYFLQNQTNNLDKSIDDVLEHFVYLPKQATANAADIPFFLSTRLAEAGAEKETISEEKNPFGNKDPVQVVARYENRAAKLAAEYEENMVRF